MTRLRGWELFSEIKNMKLLGFNKSQAARQLRADYATISKYWGMPPDDYAKLMESRKYRKKKLDGFKDEIVLWLRDYPDMSASQVLDWLTERYGNIGCTERSVRNYVRSLRTEYCIPKIKNERQYEAVDDPPMGHQAQVDFGQIWLKNTQGKRIKLYCFSMVLSHSRYKFAYWMDKPFTTSDFIYAHNKAFEYFGGMTTEVVYDQDRLIAVDENFGDIIFTEEFQKYIDLMKFKIYLCRGFDPESKGRIEAVVKFVKYNFAIHRTFTDINTFNDECLAWLDRTGNGKTHGTTKKIPKEVFTLEKEHLLPIPHAFDKISSTSSLTYVVRKDNTVLYKQNRYRVPKGTYAPGKRIGLNIKDNIISIIDIDTKEVLANHKLSIERGKLIRLSHPERDKNTKLDDMYDEVFKLLGEDNDSEMYLTRIKDTKPRYIRDQLGLIKKAAADTPYDIVREALAYCIKRDLYSATLFNDTVLFMLEKHKSKDVKIKSQNVPIPQKYKSIKTQIRDMNEYIQAMGGIEK